MKRLVQVLGCSCVGALILYYGFFRQPEFKLEFSPTMLGDRSGLHNVVRYNEYLYSGSTPDGEAGFRALEEFNIKAIVSVDGAIPNIELAERFGFQYVHIPIGYDGIPDYSVNSLADVIVGSYPKAVYIHCHHGKHRGPAAAVSAWRCIDDDCSAEKALASLHLAGTDPKYAGLYQAVETTKWQPIGNRSRHWPDAVSPPKGLTAQMVELDDRWDRIKMIRSAGWKTPKKAPDLEPAHEVLLLKEQFRESGRSQKWLREIFDEQEQLADQLERAIRESATNAVREDLFQQLESGCAACHLKERDQPRRR